MKPNSLCVSFHGWHQADRFIAAWRLADFRLAGHLVFAKPYASSVRNLRHQHEQAYLLAKGEPLLPATAISDVLDFAWTGNRKHPTGKPQGIPRPLIEAYCPPGGLVLDLFCGSGSGLVAAHDLGRAYAGIELDHRHWLTICAAVGYDSFS